MSAFELRPSGSARTDLDATDLVWSAGRGTAGTLRTDLDPWLSSFGSVPSAAVDLTRVATAAYLADLRSRRPATLSRALEIVVHVLEPDSISPALDEIADLLALLTADEWQVSIVPDVSEQPETVAAEPASRHRVALLSGGLDSFAGAVLTSAAADTVYLGHSDLTPIRASQNRVRGWFDTSGRTIDYVQVRHGDSIKRPERSTRSRSSLFMSLAVALASGRGGTYVEVAENGFTSLNPPLGPERGGALTTRSTHPVTLARFNAVLARLGLEVSIWNPHAWKTKGQLVAEAVAMSPGDFAAGAASTLSCAKLNGQYYKGGSPTSQCGLCVACITRRAAMVAAGVEDRTGYLSETLTGSALADLRRDRADDVDAVRLAITRGFDDLDLMSVAGLPDDFDFDAALDLCGRAVAELARVDLD